MVFISPRMSLLRLLRPVPEHYPESITREVWATRPDLPELNDERVRLIANGNRQFLKVNRKVKRKTRPGDLAKDSRLGAKSLGVVAKRIRNITADEEMIGALPYSPELQKHLVCLRRSIESARALADMLKLNAKRLPEGRPAKPERQLLYYLIHFWDWWFLVNTGAGIPQSIGREGANPKRDFVIWLFDPCFPDEVVDGAITEVLKHKRRERIECFEVVHEAFIPLVQPYLEG